MKSSIGAEQITKREPRSALRVFMQIRAAPEMEAAAVAAARLQE